MPAASRSPIPGSSSVGASSGVSGVTTRISLASLRSRTTVIRRWGPFAALTLLTAIVLSLAAGTWRQPVPGALMAAFGNIGLFNWPPWYNDPAGPRPGRRIVGLDGPDRAHPGAFVPLVTEHPDRPVRLGFPHVRGELFDAALAGLRSGDAIRLHFADADAPYTVTLHPLGVWPFSVLCLGSIAAAWLLFFLGRLAVLLRPESPPARALGRLALVLALVLLTIYDSHTTRRLVPFFIGAMAFAPGALLHFALTFPEGGEPLRLFLPRGPGERGEPLRRLVARLPLLLGGGLSAWTLWRWHTEQPFLKVLSLLVGAAQLALFACLVLGALRPPGSGRTALRNTWWNLGLAMLLPGLALCAPQGFGPIGLEAAFVLSFLPLSVIGFVAVLLSLIRSGDWEGRPSPPRHLLRPALDLFIVVLLGLGATLAAAYLDCAQRDPSSQTPLLRAVAGLPVLGGWLAFALARAAEGWLGDRLFSKRLPTVAQLGAWLRDLSSSERIATDVEAQVRRWLGCEHVRFLPLPVIDDPGDWRLDAQGHDNTASLTQPSSLHDGELLETRVIRRRLRKELRLRLDLGDALLLGEGHLCHLPEEPEKSGQNGQNGKADEPARWVRLLVPALHRQRVQGLLAVSAGPYGQALSAEAENFLNLLASQAGLALACVRAYEQLEELRLAQQAALRADKAAAVGAVAAEVAHEIRTPINFLRLLIDSCEQWQRRGGPPDPGDLESGREELDRLERMASHLRRLATPRQLKQRPVPLREVCDHVALVLRERLRGRTLELVLADGLMVRADRDALVQILVNLINNGLDACGSRPGSQSGDGTGRVGVRAEALSSAERRGLLLVVWDDGPGMAADVGRLFQPWFTTKPSGTGLGLPITRRLVREHGWEIGAVRRDGRTCFEVRLPPGEWTIEPQATPEETID